MPEFGKPEKTIETGWSKVFLFSNRAIKIYKYKKHLLGDLNDNKVRKSFFEEDFLWNKTFSPGIYKALQPYEGEYYIEMARVDNSFALTALLKRGAVSPEDTKKIVLALHEKSSSVNKKAPEMLQGLLDLNFLDLMKRSIEDLRQWMYLGAPYLKKPQTNDIVELLTAALDTEKYFDVHPITAAIDVNCDNIYIIDGTPTFLDIMAPKRDWRVDDGWCSIARCAVDASVLGDPELGEAVYEAYRPLGKPIPPKALLIHEIRGACIQWPYRYLIKEPADAEKFGTYAKQKMRELENLLGKK